jgi:hypothetical protein
VENLVFYFSENFPRNFTQGALLIAECLADYYRPGELAVTEYVGKHYNPIEHHIQEVSVTDADLRLLLEEFRKVQNPEHEMYQSWLEDSDHEKWLAHIRAIQQSLKQHLLS